MFSILFGACTFSQPSNKIEGHDQQQDFDKTQQVSSEGLGEKSPIIFTSTYFLKELLSQSLSETQNWQVKLIFDKHQQDPALDIPDDKVLAILPKAQAIVLNGARFEKGLESIDLPRMITIKTAQDFKSTWLSYPQGFVNEHQHGQGQNHQHIGVDGHTWMSPVRLKLQYQNLVSRLAVLELGLKQKYVQFVLKQIDKLHQKWTKLSLDLRKSQVCTIATHPAYQYIANDYKFKIKYFNIDPQLSEQQVQTQINDDQLETLQALCPQSSQIKLLWWEETPNRAVLSRLESTDYKHIIIRPMEKPPVSTSDVNLSLFSFINHDLDQLIKRLQ